MVDIASWPSVITGAGIAFFTSITAGAQRNLKFTASVTPAWRAAASMRRHSSTVSAIGFSIRMCLPAAAAASASGSCESCQVLMMTASTSGSSKARAASLVAYAPPKSSWKRAAAVCIHVHQRANFHVLHGRDVLQVTAPDESAADARDANWFHAGQGSVPCTTGLRSVPIFSISSSSSSPGEMPPAALGQPVVMMSPGIRTM